MSFLEPDNLCAAAGGQWLRRPAKTPCLDGIGIDTRADLGGKAFVAIKGDNHDGHDFLARAAAAGACLLIVSRPPDPGTLPGDVGVILVKDTRRALGDLAAAYRRRLGQTTIIAITGSVGKTTVKSLIHAVLSQTMRGRAARASFNNDIGVPLTILAADPRDRYLVVEIGANHPGEIEALAGIARPDLAVITRVGRSHLEGFGSLEAVAREKASLLSHVRPGGHAFVNADSPELLQASGQWSVVSGQPETRHRFARRREGTESSHQPRTTTLYGESPDADLRLTGRDTASGWFEINGRDRFHLSLPGRHNAVNAMAAVAVGRALGVPDTAIDEALGACEPVGMRMSRHETAGIIIYNDAYNANPDSMIAALHTFAELSAGAARRIVVLGDMNELGEAAPELHREVGRALLDVDRTTPIDRAILFGPLAECIAEPLADAWSADRVTTYAHMNPTTATEAAALLHPGDAVLLKASRAVGLERIITAMNDDAAQPVGP